MMNKVTNRVGNRFFQGVVLGGALTAAMAVGYAHASNNARSAAEELGEPSVPSLEAGNCRVDVGYGRMTYGDRCFRGEVMVGARDGYLLCADIEVSCDR